MSNAVNTIPEAPAKLNKSTWYRGLHVSWDLYILIAPALILLIIFNYVPMYGVQIAFKDYSVTKGIWASEWVGLEHFIRFFSSYNCPTLFKNTIVISMYSLVAGFPMPIVLALFLNKLRFEKLKKVTQTVSYAPHFISTVVLVGMITVFTDTSNGIINIILRMNGKAAVDFMGKPELFHHIYVWTDVWKEMGWGAIIYIASLSNISPELYESARIDGANKLQTIVHIDLPSIAPTIITLLILRSGSILSVGFEKAWLMQKPLNLTESEIISTYVYKIGIQGAQFSYSTAIGVFNSVVNALMLVVVNKISSMVSETSLW